MDPPAAITPQQLLDAFVATNGQYAFICMDLSGVVTSWSAAAEQVFGYTAAEMTGRSIADLFVPEDRERGFVEHELAIASRVGHSEDDRWHLRKDGARVWLIGVTQAIRAADGSLAGFVKVSRDRTDLRAWTEKIEHNERAVTAAHERTLAFLRTLGHEMRNPLSPLTNAAHIIERLHGDDRTAKAVEVIRSQCQSLQRLADDLMQVGQLEAGRVSLRLAEVDLRQPIARAQAAMQEAADAKGVELAAILPPGELLVRLDEDRFQQVLVNLISNAIKYTPQGGSVWLKPTQEGAEIVLRIEDTGIGIAPEVLPRIFDLFSREAQAESVDPGGLGIGLAVVREVVHLHGGSVQARSGGRGKGSEFSVRLPAAQPHSMDG